MYAVCVHNEKKKRRTIKSFFCFVFLKEKSNKTQDWCAVIAAPHTVAQLPSYINYAIECNLFVLCRNFTFFSLSLLLLNIRLLLFFPRLQIICNVAISFLIEIHFVFRGDDKFSSHFSLANEFSSRAHHKRTQELVVFLHTMGCIGACICGCD